MKLVLIFLFLVFKSSMAFGNLCNLNALKTPSSVKSMKEGVSFKSFQSVEEAMRFLQGKKFQGLFYSYRYRPLPVTFNFSLGYNTSDIEFDFSRDLSKAKKRQGCIFGSAEVNELGQAENLYRNSYGALPLRAIQFDSLDDISVKGNVISNDLEVIDSEFILSKLKYGTLNGFKYLTFRVLWKNPITGNSLLLKYILKEEKL